MAPTQESGLRENCTSRLSERAEAGRKLHLSRLYSVENPVMGLERREQVIAVASGQPETGGAWTMQWKGDAFLRWHEPYDTRVSLTVL